MLKKGRLRFPLIFLLSVAVLSSSIGLKAVLSVMPVEAAAWPTESQGAQVRM